MIDAPTVANLLRENRSTHASHVAVMRHLRAAAIEMEALVGGPVEIMETISRQTDEGWSYNITFQKATDPPAT